MTAIRLIGDDHTSHVHGTVLPIAPEAVVRNGADAITQTRAQELVDAGRAEWVQPPPSPEETAPAEDFGAEG